MTKIPTARELYTLGLIAWDPPLTLKFCRSLTEMQRAKVGKYMWKIHLRANDNIVRVPPKPACLKKFEKTHKRPMRPVWWMHS